MSTSCPRTGTSQNQGRLIPVIILTKLSGERFALNPDLVQRVEASHDTVVTLVDGAKYLVSESLDEVAERMLAYRVAVVAGAQEDTAHLRLVTPLEPDAPERTPADEIAPAVPMRPRSL
jgi:flagellar protein FlbD